MKGSTENQRFAEEQAANQIGAAIHPETGDIVIIHAGRPIFGLTPSDAAAFASGLCQIIANHPQVKAPVEATSQLVIAGSVPPFAGRR